MNSKLAIGLGFLIAASWGCSRSSQPASPSALPVRVSAVSTYQGGSGVTYSANITPYSQVNLSFKSGGYIQSILQVRGADGRMRDVQQGDWVRRGTVLAMVRTSDYENRLSAAKGQLAQAEAALEQAKLDFDRASNLFASHSLIKPDYDAAKAKYDSSAAAVRTAKAQVAEAQVELNDCSVRAPISGWVLSRDVEVGSLVGPSTPGFSIADTHLVKAVFGVPDTAIKSVNLGHPQTITTEAVPGEFHGRVTAISPSADPKSRVFSVEVTIPNPRNLLRAGMIATLTLGGSGLTTPVMAIPLSAVVRSTRRPGGFAAFVVNDENGKPVAHLRDIEIGQAYGDMISVTQGLTLGDRVVTTGATTVTDGEQVEVVP